MNHCCYVVMCRASLLCEMEQRMNASRNVAVEPTPSTSGMKLVEITPEILKETALSHQSETKV